MQHPGARPPRRLITVLPPLLVALLVVPFALHQNAWWEWANPYWFLGREAAHVSATGLPTVFLQLESGTFNPYFVYYAGPTLSVLAYPAALFGAWPVFLAATAGAMVAGYLGVWWSARTLGLSRALAVLPALAFATGPFLISTFYDRGAWAEVLAANAATVLLAGVLAIAFRRPGASDTGGRIAVAGATAVIAGTHNITLMVTAVLLPLLLAAVLPLRPPGAPSLGRALIRAAGPAALGLGLTAAWLLPNLWYGDDTLIAQTRINDEALARFPGGASASALLTPWPHVPAPVVAGGRAIHPQLPALVLVWAVAVLAVLVVRRRVPGRVATAAGALGALGTALVVLVSHQSWWLHFPSAVRAVQYPFRLLSAVTLIVALAVVVALRAVGAGAGGNSGVSVRAGRRAVAVLGVAVVAQLGFAAWVAIGGEAATTYLDVKAPREADARAAKVLPSFSLPNMLTPLQFHVSDHPTGATAISEDAGVALDDPLSADRATLSGDQPAGAQVQVPVVWSPYVKVTGGAALTGRDERGMAIVGVRAVGTDGRWTAVVSPAVPWPMAVGRALSALSLLVVVALAGVGLARRRRLRQRAHASAEAATSHEPVAAFVK